MRAVRRRPVWALAVGCLSVLSLTAGCARDPEPQSVAMMSDARPASTGSELPDLDASLDDLGLGELDDLFDQLEGLDLDEFEGAFDPEAFDELFEGLSPEDLGIDPDELGLAGIGDCFDQLMLYSQLMVSALGMGGASTTERISAELRAELPPELHDELDVVTRALAGASFSDLASGSGPLASAEFERANEAIANWLASDCNSDGA